MESGQVLHGENEPPTATQTGSMRPTRRRISRAATVRCRKQCYERNGFGCREFANTVKQSKDNRLNCVDVRSDQFTPGLASRRPWTRGVRKNFNTEEAGRTTEDHGVECRLRFARSTSNPCSVPLRRPPCFLVLKFFLYCGWHMLPRA
jgi:hypothetical protein